MDATKTTLSAMIDDIKEKRDTTETILGTPVIRYAHFTKDFKDIVRRLIDPTKTETYNSNDEETGEGHPPPSVRTVACGWEETGWVKTREFVIVSVAGRVKGIKTGYTKTIEGWSNYKTEEWIPKKEWLAKEWKRNEWRDWEYDPKIRTRSVMEYLPNDDELRIILANLFATPETNDHYAEFALDSMINPFDENANW